MVPSAPIKAVRAALSPEVRTKRFVSKDRPSKSHKDGSSRKAARKRKGGKGLMDPTEASGSRDPGDNDVMDPEL